MFETISKKVLQEGAFWTLTAEEVKLPNGNVREYHLLNHPGGVGILAIDEKGRNAMGEYCLEIPAGKRDKGPETPIDGARRELREETGCIASSMVQLAEIYPSPGMVTEKLFLFVATGLVAGERELDDDEFIQVMWKRPEEVSRLIQSGEIKDAKTICAFYLAREKGLISFS